MKLKILLASLLLSNVAMAELTQCDQIPVVIHINGINTSRGDAKRSRNMLKDVLEAELGHPIKYDLAYNQTHGFFADIAQTFYQLSQQNPDEAPERIAEALLYGEPPAGMDPRLAEAAQRYHLAQYERAMLAQLTLTEESEILRDIRQASSADDKVLLVPHSQGNLFANRVDTLLRQSGDFDEHNLRIVGVASPANQVLGGGDYVTSSNDSVINSLRLLHGVLPNNIAIPAGDAFGHGFKETYLAPGLNGRAVIVAKLMAATEAMNTSNYSHYAGAPGLQREPVILDYYGTPIDPSIWQAAGINYGQTLSLGAPHIDGPNGVFVSFPTTTPPPLTSTPGAIGMLLHQQDETERLIATIRCTSTSNSLKNGTHKIFGQFSYLSHKKSLHNPVDTPQAFAITIRGARKDYRFNLLSQQRSYLDHHNPPDINNSAFESSIGFIDLRLGDIIVEDDPITGRKTVKWIPNPELATKEIRR